VAPKKGSVEGHEIQNRDEEKGSGEDDRDDMSTVVIEREIFRVTNSCLEMI
jgi:hypothetical protein